jgi:hypothetical protein
VQYLPRDIQLCDPEKMAKDDLLTVYRFWYKRQKDGVLPLEFKPGASKFAEKVRSDRVGSLRTKQGKTKKSKQYVSDEDNDSEEEEGTEEEEEEQKESSLPKSRRTQEVAKGEGKLKLKAGSKVSCTLFSYASC